MPIPVGGGEYFAGNDVFLPSKKAKSFKKNQEHVRYFGLGEG